MGLDSFWKGKQEVAFFPELQLCGGMMPGNGGGSFRGKVYDGIIKEVTGETLYQQDIPNKTVKVMAGKLAVTKYDPRWHEEFQLTAKEYKDLVRMFRAYADAGATLHGWW